MEEEGTEDNGLEEDSRDGQVCGIYSRDPSSSVISHLVVDTLTSLYRRIWRQV